MKICKHCNTEKDIELFVKGNIRKDGTIAIGNICKRCDNLRKYTRIKNNPEAFEKFKERARIRAIRWNQRNPEKAKEKALKFYNSAKEEVRFERYINNKYKISIEDYNSKLEKQKGVCAICKEEKELHIDHCHTLGTFRGLLCCQCNTALGKFKDNIEILKSAITYLEARGY